MLTRIQRIPRSVLAVDTPFTPQAHVDDEDDAPAKFFDSHISCFPHPPGRQAQPVESG